MSPVSLLTVLRLGRCAPMRWRRSFAVDGDKQLAADKRDASVAP